MPQKMCKVKVTILGHGFTYTSEPIPFTEDFTQLFIPLLAGQSLKFKAVGQADGENRYYLFPPDFLSRHAFFTIDEIATL